MNATPVPITHRVRRREPLLCQLARLGEATGIDQRGSRDEGVHEEQLRIAHLLDDRAGGVGVLERRGDPPGLPLDIDQH